MHPRGYGQLIIMVANLILRLCMVPYFLISLVKSYNGGSKAWLPSYMYALMYILCVLISVINHDITIFDH